MSCGMLAMIIAIVLATVATLPPEKYQITMLAIVSEATIVSNHVQAALFPDFQMKITVTELPTPYVTGGSLNLYCQLSSIYQNNRRR